MKVLTVRQPWAWAIFNAGRDVETLSWTTGHRGPLLIYAGKQYDDEADAMLFALGIEVPGYEVPALSRSGIVGVVDLVASIPPLAPERVSLGPLSPRETHIAVSRWYLGGCSWLFENPMVLPHFDCGDALRGRGGLFDFDEGVLPPDSRALLATWIEARRCEAAS